VKTFQFEARHGPGTGNHGKFMVGVLDEEWAWLSGVDEGRPLMQACGWWGAATDRIWVFDLQTGEGCFLHPGGSAHADLAKHRVWVCPLFEPWLTWLYEQLRGCAAEDIPARLGELPRVVDLPGAEFALAGYRRPGPQP
jgi:hypothetical protein